MGRIQRRNLLSYCVQSKAVCLGSPGFPSEWALPGRKVLGKDIRSPCPFRWRAAAHRRKYAWQQCLLAGKRDENRPFACIVRQQPHGNRKTVCAADSTLGVQEATRFFRASWAAGSVILAAGRQPDCLVCLASHQICS